MHDPLHPYQERSLALWSTLPEPKRRILGYPTGAGKSRPAVEATREYERVVVVSPATVLYAWCEQFAKWNGEDAGVYDMSLGRKTLAKKTRARLEQALAGRVVITTPHFAFSDAGFMDVAYRGKCALILDEGDMYANPLVDRAIGLREVLARYPNLAVLLLTATILPNEVRDVWNPVQTLFPSLLPPPRKDTGGVPFAFLNYYVARDPQTGFFKGHRPDRLPHLRAVLSRVADIVEEHEMNAVVDPLQIHGLPGDETTFGAWLGDNKNTQSIAMAAWERATAERYLDAMLTKDRHVELIHGESSAKERWAKLQALRETYRAGGKVGLACTQASLLVGVSLAWFERAYVSQWRTSPREVLQFLGRFRRPDPDKRRPCVCDLLVEEHQHSMSAASKEKLAAFQALLGKNANAESFERALADGFGKALDVQFTAEQVLAMFAGNREDSAGAYEFFAEEYGDDDE